MVLNIRGSVTKLGASILDILDALSLSVLLLLHVILQSHDVQVELLVLLVEVAVQLLGYALRKLPTFLHGLRSTRVYFRTAAISSARMFSDVSQMSSLFLTLDVVNELVRRILNDAEPFVVLKPVL